MITEADLQQYKREGYTVARQLFSEEEVTRYRDHFMRLRELGSYPGDAVGVEPAANDPLKRYPRMIHMHRWDELSLQWLLDRRLAASLAALLGREPFAVQTMLYFKPPQSRGQALHQDQYYLRVDPGTCMAAWLALDPCDEANGCLQVVPGSQDWDLLCTERADVKASVIDVTVPVPEGAEVRPVIMQPGDVLFFNGSMVHGSFPNTTTDRFRRSLIGHYIEGDSQQVAAHFSPALRMDGTLVELEASERGGLCGVWVEEDGTPVLEMVGTAPVHSAKTHE